MTYAGQWAYPNIIKRLTNYYTPRIQIFLCTLKAIKTVSKNKQVVLLIIC